MMLDRIDIRDFRIARQNRIREIARLRVVRPMRILLAQRHHFMIGAARISLGCQRARQREPRGLFDFRVRGFRDSSGRDRGSVARAREPKINIRECNLSVRYHYAFRIRVDEFFETCSGRSQLARVPLREAPIVKCVIGQLRKMIGCVAEPLHRRCEIVIAPGVVSVEERLRWRRRVLGRRESRRGIRRRRNHVIRTGCGRTTPDQRHRSRHNHRDEMMPLHTHP